MATTARRAERRATTAEEEGLLGVLSRRVWKGISCRWGISRGGILGMMVVGEGVGGRSGRV